MQLICFEMLWLIPLVIGGGILVLAFMRAKARGANMNHRRLGAAFMLSAILIWLSTAIQLVQEGEYYFVLNAAFPILFFMGIGYQFPGKGDIHEYSRANKPLQVFVGVGAALGFAHALALSYSVGWPAFLIRCYAALGVK